MPTIKDVALHAHVSVTTVSHVVNQTRFVSERARVRVQAAIDELKFVPSALARSLRKNRTHTIGMMIPNCSNPYFAEINSGEVTLKPVFSANDAVCAALTKGRGS